MTAVSPLASEHRANQSTVSIVVPVLNEQDNIGQLADAILGQLDSIGCMGELILVDDGSSDQSWAIISELSRSESRVQGLKLSRNFGKEGAMLAGIEHASGAAVIVMDGDGQHPPDLIPQMIEAWSGGAEIVEAVKVSRADQGLFARIASRLFNKLFGRLTGVDFNNATDYRLLSRPAVDALLQLPERAFFFRGLSTWLGFSVAKLPFHAARRTRGHSKFSTVALLRLAARSIIAFTSAPLYLVTAAGLLFTALAFVLGLHTLWMWSTGEAVEGFTTLILLVLIHGSVVMTALGIIGQYISQIHREVKARPRFLVAERTAERMPADRSS